MSINSNYSNKFKVLKSEQQLKNYIKSKSTGISNNKIGEEECEENCKIRNKILFLFFKIVSKEVHCEFSNQNE